MLDTQDSWGRLHIMSALCTEIFRVAVIVIVNAIYHSRKTARTQQRSLTVDLCGG